MNYEDPTLDGNAHGVVALPHSSDLGQCAGMKLQCALTVSPSPGLSVLPPCRIEERLQPLAKGIDIAKLHVVIAAGIFGFSQRAGSDEAAIRWGIPMQISW